MAEKITIDIETSITNAEANIKKLEKSIKDISKKAVFGVSSGKSIDDEKAKLVELQKELVRLNKLQEKLQLNSLTHAQKMSAERLNVKKLEAQRLLEVEKQHTIQVNALADKQFESLKARHAKAATLLKQSHSIEILAEKQKYKEINDAHSAGRAQLAKAEKEYSKTAMGALTAGTTFGHKLVTTGMYATAGAGLYALAGGFTNLKDSIIESDKAIQMFKGVLEASDAEAKALQKSVFEVGKAYGGSTKELNETTLTLGRAGLKTSELAEGLKVVSQAALISGDSLGDITEMLASWKTVYPEASLTHLGDVMAKIANESLLSIGGLKTATSYITAAGAEAGVTADNLIELAGAWKQTGKADSIVGTEIRRLFKQIEGGSEEARKAYWAMGIDINKVNAGLKSGDKETQEASLRSFMAQIQQYDKLPAEKKKSVEKILSTMQVLDKQTIQSSVIASREYSKMEGYGEQAANSLEKSSVKIALSYEKMWERIKVAGVEASTKFEEGFKKGFSSASVTAEEFDTDMKKLSDRFNEFARIVGVVSGTVVDKLDDIVVAFALFKIGGALQVGLSAVEVGLISQIGVIDKLKKAWFAFNLVVRSNPIVMAVIAGWSLYELADSYRAGVQEEFDKKSKEWEGTQSKLGTARNKELESTSGKIKSITQAIEAQTKALNNQNLTQAQRKSIQNGIIENEKRINDLTKGSNKKTVDTSAVGAMPSSEKDKKSKAGEAERIARQELKTRLATVEAAEKEYFYNNLALSTLEKKEYHANNTLPKLERITNEYKSHTWASDDIKKAHENTLDALIEINAINTKIANTSFDRSELAKLDSKYANDLNESSKIEYEYKKELVKISKEVLDAQVDGSLNVLDVEYKVNAAIDARQKATDNLTNKRKLDIEATTLELKNQQNAYNAQYASAMAVSDVQANRLAFEASITAQKDRQNKLQANFNTEMQSKGLSAGNEYYDAKNKLMKDGIDLIEKEIELSKELQAMKAGDDLINQAERLVDAIGDVGSAWTKASKAMLSVIKVSKTLSDTSIKGAIKLKDAEEKRSYLAKTDNAFRSNSARSAKKERDEEAKTKQEIFQADIQGYSQVAGAMAGFFEAGSDGAKVMQAAQAALAITSGVSAILAQGTDPLTGPARMAAMASIVGGLLGIAGIAFSGGGASIPALDPNAGTVLGGTIDEYGRNSEVTQSLTNIQELMDEVHASEYAQLIGINRAVTSMAKGIEGAVTNLFRSGALDVNSISSNSAGTDPITRMNDSIASISDKATAWMGSELGSIASTVAQLFVNPVGTIAGILGLGGSNRTDYTGSGIDISGGTLGQKASGDVGASSFIKYENVSRDWKGSTSYDYHRDITALDSATQHSISLIYKSFNDTMIMVNEGLGSNLESAIEGFKFEELSLDLKGKSGEEATKALSDAFSAQGDKMVTTIFGDLVMKYQELGEGLLETATRVIVEKEVLLRGLGDIGKTVSGDTIALTQSLLDFSGGLQNLQDATSIYYDKYFTDAEKLANSTKHIQEQFAKYGATMPKTTEEFRALVTAQELATEAGQEAYVALLGVSGAFYDVASVAEDAMAVINEERKALQDTLDLLTGVTTERGNELKALDPSNRALQERIWAIEDEKIAIEKANEVEKERIATISTSIESQYSALVTLSNAYKTAGKSVTDYITTLTKQPATVEAINNAISSITSPEDISNAQSLITELYNTNAQAIKDKYSAEAKLIQDNMQASAEAFTDSEKATIDAQKETLNIRIDALKAEKEVLETLYDYAKNIRDTVLVESGDTATLFNKFNDSFDTLKSNIMSGTDATTSLSNTTGYATSYLDATKKSAKSQAEIAYAQAQLAMAFESFQGTGRVSSLSSLEEELIAIEDLASKIKTATVGTYDNTTAMNAELEVSKKDTIKQLERLKEAGDSSMMLVNNRVSSLEKTSIAYLGEDSPIVKWLQSINSGVSTFGTTLAEYNSAQALKAATTSNQEKWVNTGTTDTYLSSGGAVATKPAGVESTYTINTTLGSSFSNLDAKKFVDDKLAAGYPLDVYNAAVAHGISSNSLDGIMGWAAGTSMAWVNDYNKTALVKLKPFSSGGYTGDMSANSIAGVVHGKEYVVNAKTTKDLGLNGGGGFIVDLLNEIIDLKELTVRLVADSGKILQVDRAILSYTEGVA